MKEKKEKPDAKSKGDDSTRVSKTQTATERMRYREMGNNKSQRKKASVGEGRREKEGRAGGPKRDREDGTKSARKREAEREHGGKEKKTDQGDVGDR
uniref:Uncharacterized protein n=1 Tax=Knipowitschia caucasica TaxID=637954 RepID=A0AAV2J1X8_KNICA